MGILSYLHQRFLETFGPAVFSGITMRPWWRVLRENKFQVAPRYLGRTVTISLLSLNNSIGKRIEDTICGKSIATATVQPPLFILGCWRSGTTHLHNLLSKDERFAFPNSYQVMNPHTFLLNESWNAPIQNLFYPAKRMMDNVAFGANQPQEDEFAIASTCALSPMTAFSFWNNRDRYNRFTAFSDVEESEVQAWKDSLHQFLKKLSSKYERPLILKSPAHTAKVATLLEMYPDAKFVMIHRNPYEVIVSAHHMYSKNLPILALQKFDLEKFYDELGEHFGQLFDAYFEQRDLVPEGRLVELPFSDLDADPVGSLRHIYRELSLPDFTECEPAVTDYVESLADYQKNAHALPPEEIRRLVNQRWRRCFDEWGYELLE